MPSIITPPFQYLAVHMKLPMYCSALIYDPAGPVGLGRGEPTPSLPRGENPEIGNLSIFRFLTPNLVSKVSYSSKQFRIYNQQAKNRGRF
jgi:hypothetical protein